MTYARITDGTIDTLGNLPAGARRLDTGNWVTPPGGVWPPELAAACGWHEVTETPRPANTADGTYVKGEAVVDGLPVRVWTWRAWTVEELAAQTESVNETTIRDRARTALTANDKFLALTSPTNAQVAAQVKLLTRECTALIRLAVRALDTIDGT